VNNKILPPTKLSTTADKTAGHAVSKEASTEHDQSCFSHRKVQEIQHSFRPALRHKGSMVVPVQIVCSLLVLDQALTGLYICLQKSPSQLVDELTNAPKYIEGWRPKPSVVQLLNIAEYSHQVGPL